MNPTRLAFTILAVFAGKWATDFLIHAVWLDPDYRATMSLWRPEAEMKAHMPWLFLGQAIAAVAFVVLWSKGFPATASLGGACLYGVFMGLFIQSGTLVTYAVQPFPAGVAVKWFCSGVVQGALLGLLAWVVYRP